ncbi:MAG: BolA family protein [Methyloligellaceae bacterium]
MSVEQTIREKLTEAFTPLRLDVRNDSHLHAGHDTSPGTGESHFHVTIVSEKFDGLARIERHRLVNDALARELAGPVHALSIKAMTLEESRGK